jgi:hypothetical protein
MAQIPTPNPDPSDAASRRRAERREAQGPLRVLIDTPAFEGTLDNLSPLGVFFFSKERVRVRVELQVDGQPRSYTGQLVRVVQMNAEQNGFAIEFDPA